MGEVNGRNGQSWQTRLKARIAKVQLSGPWVLLAGLGLVAVPTVFTVLAPELVEEDDELNRILRIGVVIGWFVAAAFVGLVSLARDRAWDLLIQHNFEQRRSARLAAVRDALTALLKPGTKDFPLSYEFTLYLYDENGDVLRPYFPKRLHAVPPDWPDDEDPRDFRPSHGATGQAWAEDTTFEVHGSAVSDDLHGLSEPQQRFFAEFASVVATPVWVDDEKIGVLTAISRDEDRYFDSLAAQAALRELADSIGVIMRYLADSSDVIAGA